MNEHLHVGEGELSEKYWLDKKLPLEKPNNFFRTPDTLEEMQKIVKASTPETMMIVAMAQNFLLKDYNEVVIKHNRLCVTLADGSMSDYDAGYQDGWDECIEANNYVKEEEEE